MKRFSWEVEHQRFETRMKWFRRIFWFTFIVIFFMIVGVWSAIGVTAYKIYENPDKAAVAIGQMIDTIMDQIN